MCAAGASGPDQLDLISCGNCLQLLRPTSENNVNYVDQTYWYNNIDAFGFSPSPNVSINGADVYDCVNIGSPEMTCTDDLRLSWPLNGLYGSLI